MVARDAGFGKLARAWTGRDRSPLECIVSEDAVFLCAAGDLVFRAETETARPRLGRSRLEGVVKREALLYNARGGTETWLLSAQRGGCA
jgi:hypothetical protein